MRKGRQVRSICRLHPPGKAAIDKNEARDRHLNNRARKVIQQHEAKWNAAKPPNYIGKGLPPVNLSPEPRQEKEIERQGPRNNEEDNLRGAVGVMKKQRRNHTIGKA
jgi:hypothetical protein